ncbi:MAG: NADH-quinone oxidoreductase subunit NuoN [Gammaproteobacteria bacterium]|nr:NADH-quinone oxidoreductase subunit NuoN [Gammaproteobacteria bacterium]
MIGISTSLLPALPEIILLVTACVALLADLFLQRRFKSVSLCCAAVGLSLAAYVSFLFIGQYPEVGFHGLFISDDLGHLMKLFIYLTVFLSFIYSKSYLNEHQVSSGDYYVLGLFSTLGMMVLVSTHSLITMYLGVELLSLPLYAMTAMRRSHGNSSEAAMKYFVIGSIASAMLLYGMSLLYGATGSLDFAEIAHIVGSQPQPHQGLLSFALVFILAGVGFKLAAVPFHMWAPDVYDGAPTSVTLFLSAAPKIAAIGMTIRILSFALGDLSSVWQQMIMFMAIASIVLGNAIAIVQKNIKRMLAYSTISHMGYALLGILINTPEGYASALFYVLVYALMAVAAFGLLVLLSRSGLEVEMVQDLNGLNKRNPWLAFMMMIILFSMAGVPPTVGFFSKLLILKALVDVHMTWLAVLGLIFAVVGAYYYLYVIKAMYFDEAKDKTPISLSRTTTALFSANALSLLYFGIVPGVLIAMCMSVFA